MEIKREQIQVLLDYLQSKPYGEVYQLINMLININNESEALKSKENNNADSKTEKGRKKE
jgi:hypothetical protein